MNTTLTIREFLELLRQADMIHGAEGSMDFQHNKDDRFNLESWAAAGRIAGWLEAQDLVDLNRPIERRTIARILHEYLRMVLKETDEISIQPANVLLDLYDCRTCVNHVAQMYLKGIMDAVPAPKDPGKKIFGMREGMTHAEAERAILCLWRPEFRYLKGGTVDNLLKSQVLEVAGISLQGLEMISQEELMEWKRIRQPLLLIDVRSEAEYALEHIEGAVNIPFMRLIENPQLIQEKRGEMIVLYCDQGIRSRMTAESLLENGYLNVRYASFET